MNLCIIGTGFVGVVSAAVFASHGNQVIGLDIDDAKIAKLKQGVVPFYEPGLTDLLLSQQKAGTLSFTSDYQTAIAPADVILIAVGTPSLPDGKADLKYVFAAADSMAPHLKEGAIVVIKSTVPPGTLKDLRTHIESKTKVTFFTAALPEFLKEGTAVEDTLHPDRIMIGTNEPEVYEKLAKLHEPFHTNLVHVSPESAQMAKYASNAYLATRITFINQIADLCEQNGADIQEVITAMGFDKRIGSHYWYPGLGYGGSCFPKDVKELAAFAKEIGETENLLITIDDLNEQRLPHLMERYGAAVGGWQSKKVAVLGLAFKPNTNDMREAPSVKVIPYLLEKGASVVGYDPQAVTTVPFFIKQHPQASYTEDLAAAVKDADVIMALVEWPQIVQFDFAGARQTGKAQWVIDARNQLDGNKIAAAGFGYLSIGRKA